MALKKVIQFPIRCVLVSQPFLVRGFLPICMKQCASSSVIGLYTLLAIRALSGSSYLSRSPLFLGVLVDTVTTGVSEWVGATVGRALTKIDFAICLPFPFSGIFSRSSSKANFCFPRSFFRISLHFLNSSYLFTLYQLPSCIASKSACVP